VHTFARDIAASGGYFILCSGQQVAADTTSIVGNIGAVIPKLQLDGLLSMTSLEHKSLCSSKYTLLTQPVPQE
jgi:ClpP class serine protease